MKKIYKFIFVLNIVLILSADIGGQQFCSVSSSGVDLSYFDLSEQGNQPDYRLKLYFNIVRHDNGEGGYDPIRIPILRSIIDDAFNPYGIYFNYVCENNFVDSDERIQNGTSETGMCDWGQYLHDDGIDVFIITGFNVNDGDGGYANNIPGRFVVLRGPAGSVDKNTYVENTTIVHELGHIFGLLHMFHGCNQNPLIWDNNECTDNPDGLGCGGDFLCPWSSQAYYSCESMAYERDLNECAEYYIDEYDNNGATAGDYIPDTPPSHYLIERHRPNPDCTFDNNKDVYNSPDQKPTDPLIVDPKGNNYNPDYNNYMSYNPYKECRDHFTPNQVTVMKNYLADDPTLQQFETSETEVCDCTYDGVINIEGTKYLSDIVSEYNLDQNVTLFRQVIINGSLIVDMNYTFSGNIINMLFNSSMKIEQGNTLNLDNVHIFGCGKFWDRIYIESGATINISGNSLIEDGRTAIFAQRGANVNIDYTVFNNNDTGVSLDGTGVGQRTNISISNTTFKSDESYTLIAEGSTFSRPYCGINVRGQNRVYLRTDASNKNYFQRLQNGIVASHSSIRVAYSEFSDIHKDSDIESPYLLSRRGYAVKILSGNSISSANHNTITDSDYGIGAKSGGYLIAFANTISVDRIGILGVQLDKIRVKANTISAAEKGVFVGESENMHVYFSQIFDNYVTMTSNDEAAKAVDIQSTNNMDIYNNTIEILNNEAGIKLNIANNTRLENNTIDIYENGSFVTNGVKITSSTDLEVNDNLIEDFSGPSTDNIGINTEAGDAEYLCNFTYFMDEGMHFTGNSDFTRLLGNNYNYNQRDIVIGDAAVTGSSYSESWIGPQYEGNNGFGNIWTDDDSRVHNSATVEGLKKSEFRVNGFQDSRYMPDHVEAVAPNEWFKNRSDYENMHPCDDDPGSDLPPKYNCAYIIKRILQIDTMSKAGDCQKIVWMYRYYKKLVKLKNKHLLSDDCLTFINSRKDSVMVQLSDISLMMDSIAQLQQSTSSLLLQLIDLDDRLTDLSDQNMEGTKEWNEVLVEYDQKSLEYQNALEVENTADLTQLDSLENVLNDVSVIDSCLKVLKKTYKTKLKWMKADSLTNPELQYLKEVAEYCPDEYGESVYQARAMLSSYENRRYPTMIECSSGDVAPRSAESSNSHVKEMQIFPNPASDKLNIVIKSGKDIEGRVEIMDVKGKLLYSLEVNKYKTSFEVDIKDFNSGLYLVKYKSKTGTVNIEKLIISK